jgi:hypothetical protein
VCMKEGCDEVWEGEERWKEGLGRAVASGLAMHSFNWALTGHQENAIWNISQSMFFQGISK